MRVLFITNSYSYANQGGVQTTVQEMVELLAETAGYEFIREASNMGGGELQQHWNDTQGVRGRERLENGDFDLLILNGNVRGPATFEQYAEQFIDLARDNGTSTMLWGIWTPDNRINATTDTFTEEFHDRYSDAALATGAAYSPVGLSYRDYYYSITAAAGDNGETAETALTYDNIHSTTLGSFVAAATMFATIYDERPPLTNLPDGITLEQAQEIVDIAWANHQQFSLSATGDTFGDSEGNGAVAGTVFVDADAGGIQSSSEEGFSGLELTLRDAATNDVVATTTSAADGTYLFEGLVRGDYIVSAVLPDNATFTAGDVGTNDRIDSDISAVTGDVGSTAEVKVGPFGTVTNIDIGLVLEEEPAGPTPPVDFDTTIEGTEGRDRLNGTDGNDYFNGGAGIDVINGGGGADYIVAGTGNDRVTGGEGADIIYFEAGHGRMTVQDFEAGTDLFHLGAGMSFDDATRVWRNEDQGRVTIRFGDDDRIQLFNVDDVNAIDADDFVSVSGPLSDAPAPEPEPEPEPTLIAQSGTATFTQASREQWFSVEFAQEMVNPIVSIGGISTNGIDPGAMQVRDITSTGFEYRFAEWEYLDGAHATETMHWMAVEEGTHVMDDGAILQAGRATVDTTWNAVSLADTWGGSDYVLSTQVTSQNDDEIVVDRVRNLSDGSFEVLIQERESADRVHGDETVDWIAVSEGNFDAFAAGTTENLVTHLDFEFDLGRMPDETSAVLLDMQTTDGGDTATIRYRDITDGVARVFIEEETSREAETSHTSEVVGWIVADEFTFI